MSSPTYPGVYVTEAPGGARPVAAVGTSTAAFVGLTEWGPSNTAVRLTNWSDYQRQFGSFIPNSYLAQSVFAFFSNGGTQCYVVRAGDPGHTASVVVKNEKDVDGIRFFAAHPGTAGNALVLTLELASAAPGSELKITVSRESTATGGSPGTLVPLEVYDNLSMDPRSPSFLPTALSRSAVVRVEVEPGNTAVQPGALIGGARPVLPLEEAGAVPDTQVARHRVVSVNVNGDGWQDVELGTAALSSADVAVVAEELQSRVRALNPLRASTPADAYGSFTVSVQDDGGVLLLTAGAVTGTGPTVTSSVEVRAVPADDASRMLKLLSADGASGRGPFAERRPHPALKQVHLGDEPDGAHIGTVVAGTDGADPVDSDFTTAFHALDTVTDVSLLAAPGEGSPSMVSAGMDYCAGRSLQDVFFIGEMGVDDVSLDDALQFRQRIPTPSSYGAVYFPWMQATDPSGISANPLLLPPSGFICGLYARTDATRGVWKAPAGTSAGLRGSIGLTAELTDVEHGVLNLQDVNVIRQFPGTGIVAFGARTLAAAEPEWRYVPVRRTAIMLRTSIYQGIQWAVFEPNNETLWAQLRLSIRSFMMRLFRQGAFKGATPDQAFFVKCDAETTTQDDIDLGIVNVKVGFAPLKPAEFVIVTVSQQAGQSASPAARKRSPMARFTVNTDRFDPYLNFKFKVMFDGAYVAGLSKCSALRRTTEVTAWYEAGDHASPRQIPGKTRYEPITLEAGITFDRSFEQWAESVNNYRSEAAMSLKSFRKDLTIDVFNLQGGLILRYHVYRCWVSDYQALPELSAEGHAVMLTTIKLENEGWDRDPDVPEVPETSSAGLATGKLPHGYIGADGIVHAEIELRALAGHEEEFLARDSGRGSAAAVTEVLRRCLTRLGTLDMIDASTVRGMLVGDRQYLMLKLREATFGDLVRGSVPCPWPDCGHRIAITFSTRDVPVVAAAERGPVHTLVLSEHAGDGSVADRTVRFRLPTGADQEELSLLVAEGESTALTALLRACVLCIGSREAGDVVAALTPLARQEIEDRMAAIAPRLDLMMTATCVECGRAFEAPFDLQGFFFGEVKLTPDALRREVHYLAYHYHWSEQDILDMDRGRRRGYIEILSDEIERLNERA